MSKPPFPEIADEIRPTPKPKLDLAMKPRSVPEDAIAKGARMIGEKWGSVTQLPAREAKVEPEPSDHAKWPSIRVECPSVPRPRACDESSRGGSNQRHTSFSKP